MKLCNRTHKSISKVAPLVGAWIEIKESISTQNTACVAPLVGAWIEIIYRQQQEYHMHYVAPLVGAWIEIRES